MTQSHCGQGPWAACWLLSLPGIRREIEGFSYKVLTIWAAGGTNGSLTPRMNNYRLILPHRELSYVKAAGCFVHSHCARTLSSTTELGSQGTSFCHCCCFHTSTLVLFSQVSFRGRRFGKTLFKTSLGVLALKH